MIKKILICIILLIAIYPVSAEDVSLNIWSIGAKIFDNGSVDYVLQAEIDNSGTSQIDGFSFIIPSSDVNIISHISWSAGETIKKETVPQGTKLKVMFKSSLESGSKWNGKIDLIAKNWAKKQRDSYSINIPIQAPKIIVSNNEKDISSEKSANVKVQVFLPKGVELTSVTPKPTNMLFQYNKIVLTWFIGELNIGDTINIKANFSDTLNKIVEINDKINSVSEKINKAKQNGLDVSEAEEHLEKAKDYNTKDALNSYWKKEYSKALEYSNYAEQELNKAEASLSNTKATETMETTETTTETPEKTTPGFELFVLITGLYVSYIIRRKNT